MKKIIIYLNIAVLTGFLFSAGPFSVSGQNLDEIEAARINHELKLLTGDIDDKKNDIKRMQQKQEEYAAAIKAKQNEKASLNNQLAILDNRLAKTELDISLVETQIERATLEIQKTDIEIASQNKHIGEVTEDIENVLRQIHQKDNVTSLEILLLNDSFTDFLSEVKYLEDVNKTIREKLESLKNHKTALEKNMADLSKHKSELAGLKDELLKKKEELAGEQDTKLYVLAQASQSETQYQRLLAQAKKEQEEAAAEIASIERLIRAKMASLEGKQLAMNDNGFVWPVTKNVVTAYFRDPTYPFRYIFEHPGIDIRAAQGSTLKAAASGYVARVKFDGTKSYGYIMLIHGDGLSTVYGHISRAYVKEDEYVVQGQTIGLTGGLPGTPGAGGLTTGPHLHFEIRLDGLPVDPLSYLP
jgi:murein DD-endopeptidase MepM/ murein hydrolase activator NlpD